MKLIITYKDVVYKDRSRNPKKFVEYKIEDSGSLVRNPPHYGNVEIDQICVVDDTIKDITEKYTKTGKDQTIHILLREIFYDYGFKF